MAMDRPAVLANPLRRPSRQRLRQARRQRYPRPKPGWGAATSGVADCSTGQPVQSGLALHDLD